MSTPSVPPTTSLERKRSHLTIADVKDGYTTRPLSNLLWNQEFLTCYGPNGCHTVCLGDTFKDGRYKVVRKLGYDNSSTVWLAQDTSTDTLVALKIRIAHESGSTSRREVTALETLHANKATSKLFPVLYDDFVHNGPNGAHRCIVMQVLGPSLRLVLEATATLHEAGFAHGDLDTNNIVFSIRNMAKLSNKAFVKKLGKLETAELLRADGSPPDDYLPKQLVGAAEWDGWIDEDEEDIRLIDAGESFRVGDRFPSSKDQGGVLRPPETLFEETFDYRVDLWRVGDVIYCLLYASCPFMYLGHDCHLVDSMIDLIGALPSEWEPQWQQIREASGCPVESSRDANPTTTELETDFRERVPEPQLAVLLPVLQGLMRFRPEDRISARDALALLDQGNSKDASGSSGADESSNEAELSSEEESSSERE
ncbi:hypothetical protein LMH87_005302 [Akanthomyces muscarius]|uniref:Protein kinase domain-containing protein n=1 Tax=Akanthomyces muscarius TaxID=2231603 RepID=A0A9W8QN05_AKAMU|nr:hypothetical protein LMH87_005302 [Akanthomyces muscarius]KAJ4163581.1 hypothetical protein LMH87_005302 [Akanthomyces muscarius]